MKVILNGVRAEMARRGVSQKEVAERLDVHYNTVNNWLAGRYDPGVEGLILVMRAIGMTDTEILDMSLRDLITVQDNGNERAPA